MSTSRPHSSAGNKNKWAPSSSVVESRNKARELSRALERAASDLKAIDRQFQLLDQGLLSEEELKRFAGKSFFQKNAKPKRYQYIDAAETVQKRQRQEDRMVQQKLSLKRQRSPSSPPPPQRLAKLDHHPSPTAAARPISPYAGTRTQSMVVGADLALSGIRDDRVEEDRRRHHRHHSSSIR